mmetsp:Transcript_9760/g.15863  ORF Transcript_9760/g.15863 Transcript_9760/m.15863 type:complete len:155 (-) Transcript_9760:26-490(-)
MKVPFLAFIGVAILGRANSADYKKHVSSSLRTPPASTEQNVISKLVDDSKVKGSPVTLNAHAAADAVDKKATANKKEELRPIGEGAYQDSKAVMERTVDKNMHCEEGKWHDCYKNKGDYLDGYGKDKKASFKSGASDISRFAFVASALFCALAF